jgi:polysaccharide export outer membrane protein
MAKNIKKTLCGTLFLTVLLFSSCKTSQKVLYLQDAVINNPEVIEKSLEITILPKDLIMIVVSSKDASLAALFNLPLISHIAGYGGDTPTNRNNQLLGYTVDQNGNIDFPVLGNLAVAGLTRKQLSLMIKERLIDEKLLNDPVVTVDFINLKINILGEVNKPGPIPVERDQITLLEAISLAGDLTIFGKRDGVLVIRETGNTRTTFKVDLRSSALFSSPVYHLRQNDVVYVEPNNVRAGQSTINENNLKSVSLWLSIASLMITLGVLFFKK